MEFTLICPNDGHVELGLEDISAVVFRDADSLDVVFVCPRCGATLRAALRIPNLIAAAAEIARFAEEAESPRDAETASAVARDRRERERREREGEPYCEYFRRQLDSVECVEDLLAEFGEER